MSLERSLLAAQGYIELGMMAEATEELDKLTPADQENEEALQLRLFVFMHRKDWEAALALCSRLRENNPSCATGFIHGAFCLHEMGRTQEARDLLLQGPSHLQEEPTYHYNLGCYNAVLGRAEEALEHLRTSFKMDQTFREIARVDPDLASVYDAI